MSCCVVVFSKTNSNLFPSIKIKSLKKKKKTLPPTHRKTWTEVVERLFAFQCWLNFSFPIPFPALKMEIQHSSKSQVFKLVLLLLLLPLFFMSFTHVGDIFFSSIFPSTKKFENKNCLSIVCKGVFSSTSLMFFSFDL